MEGPNTAVIVLAVFIIITTTTLCWLMESSPLGHLPNEVSETKQRSIKRYWGEKLDPSRAAGGNVPRCSHRKTAWHLLKRVNTVTIGPSDSNPGYAPAGNGKKKPYKNVRTTVHSSVIYEMQKARNDRNVHQQTNGQKRMWHVLRVK